MRRDPSCRDAVIDDGARRPTRHVAIAARLVSRSAQVAAMLAAEQESGASFTWSASIV
jgi:hypothetical protein